MKFGIITRGDKKIYISLTASCPKGGRLLAESYAKGAGVVPALIATRDETRGEYVLILPALRVGQEVMVRVLDADGTIVDTAKRNFGHFASAFSSKFNTFSKKSMVDDIRNFDRYGRSDVSEIELKRLCAFGPEADGSELIQIMIVTHCDSQTTYKTPLSVSVFDRQGRQIEIENLTFLSDRIDHPVPGSNFSRRIIYASFRKMHSEDWFYIWARFEDDALPEGFLGIDGAKCAEIREWSENAAQGTAASSSYEGWFYSTQKKAPAELDAQRTAHFEIEPTFSIIVPLYKTPVQFFEEMCASVLGQTYAKFELILVNSSPEDKALGAAVARCVASDSRIRVITLDKNLGIAGNTNKGIRAAIGDFLCFFDHDDVLEPNILFEYVDALNRYPETDLFYCDEDKLTDGYLYDGFLKPDFSWEFLTTNNYVCHLLAVRKSIVDTVELSPNELSGVQDWDMTMKVAEKARNIFHVRKVLYHWRVHGQSTASGSGAKSYTHAAGELALLNHFERINIPVCIHDGYAENRHRVEYLLPEQEDLVSIVIPNKDHVDMLSRCLDSIRNRSTYQNIEIIVVENNSTEDETFAYYERLQAEHDDVKVVFYSGSFNFAAICNFGVRHSQGVYLLFLNNDMEVITPNWIELLIGPLQRPEVAVAGAKLLYPDDTIQHAGVVIPKSGPMHVECMIPSNDPGYFGIIQNARDVLAVTGACLMTRREDFDCINGFDEDFIVNYNDVDLCLRLRAQGKSVVMVPFVELYHYESVSRGSLESNGNLMRCMRELSLLQQRWLPYFVEGDPFYGVNIKKDSPYYVLDWNVRA